MFDTILLQKEQVKIKGGYLSVLQEEAHEALNSILYHAWREQTHPSIATISLQEVTNYMPKHLRAVLPIGSIEFVQSVMTRAYQAKEMTPLNIPSCLAERSLWKRRIAFTSHAEGVNSLFQAFKTDTLFIKSASKLKTDITGIYDRTMPSSKYDAEPLLFVSEVLPLETDRASEWRLFSFNGRIVDMRNYSGSPWSIPPEDFCKQVSSAAAPLGACTIDIAMTDAGEPAIIEVHNFISCGLYGAEVPLAMYKRAFIDEITRCCGILPEPDAFWPSNSQPQE